MTNQDYKLVEDGGFRWREDVTEAMSGEQVEHFLWREAARMEQQEEWDSAYTIYRELVWRTGGSAPALRELARIADKIGLLDVVNAVIASQ